MRPRTALDLDDARLILDRFALRLIDRSGHDRIAPLGRGTINANYRVETSAGPMLIRICEGKSEADAAFEADLIWHLGCAGLHTPPLWRSRRGEAFVLLDELRGRGWQQDWYFGPEVSEGAAPPVMVLPWVAGHEHTEDEIGPREARSVGAALALLHRAAADFPRERTGIYTLPHIRERIVALGNNPRIPADTAAHLREQADKLASARRQDLPPGLGHNDLFPDNVFFGGAGTGRRPHEVAWALDLEQAATLPYAYDVAVALISFCAPVAVDERDGPRIGPLVTERARALVEGYTAVRPLVDAERAGLLDELRFAALRFTVTRLTDVYLHTAAVTPHPSPPPSTEPARHSKDYRDMLWRLTLLSAVDPAELRAAIF